MKTIFEHLRQHILISSGAVKPKPAPPLEAIRLTNWFPNAIRKARSRMVMGFFRYGYFKDQNQIKYDRIGSAIERLEAYIKPEGGNTEHLIDALNLCGIEFESPNHPKAYFKSVDDGPIHVKTKGKK